MLAEQARELTLDPEKVTEGANMGIGRCFGTFGELLQGVLPRNDREFLVTLPISRYSTATFEPSSGMGEVRVYPSHKEKSRRLAETLMRVLGRQPGGFLCIESELPAGKGCASSSADMVATARAVQSSLGVSISRSSLARMMSGIEPSDGVMYPGIVSFYHREGVLGKFLGHLPPLTIAGLDEGGQVDTVEFNRRPKPFGHERMTEYEELLRGIERAIARRDLQAVGEISTRSAVLNEELLPKEHLDLLLDMRRRHGALGVVAAHSGTHLGLLLEPGSGSLPAIIAELARHGRNVRIVHTHAFQTA